MAQVSTPPLRMMHRSWMAVGVFGPPVRLAMSVRDSSKTVRKASTLLGSTLLDGDDILLRMGGMVVDEMDDNDIVTPLSIDASTTTIFPLPMPWHTMHTVARASINRSVICPPNSKILENSGNCPKSSQASVPSFSAN